MNTVETRIPSARNWARVVSSVSPTAKTGHDWAGEFVTGGSLIDLEPGVLVITCDGKRTKEITMSIMRDSGKWVHVDHLTSDEWAYGLRKSAIAWLSMTQEERVTKAYDVRCKELQAKVDTWTKYLTDSLVHMREQAPAEVEKFTKELAACEAKKSAWLASLQMVTPSTAVENPLAVFTSEQLLDELRSRGILAK